MDTVYTVTEYGGTFWFDSREDAERFLLNEAWNGTVHLGIGALDVPENLTGQERDEYITSRAPYRGACDEN